MVAARGATAVAVRVNHQVRVSEQVAALMQQNGAEQNGRLKLAGRRRMGRRNVSRSGACRFGSTIWKTVCSCSAGRWLRI